MLYSHPQWQSFGSQVYGTRDVNGANRTSLLLDSLGIGEDSYAPVHLQLSQPRQQNYETPTRATKLGYVIVKNYCFNQEYQFTFQNYDPGFVCSMTAAGYNCISEEGTTTDGCYLVSINKVARG